VIGKGMRSDVRRLNSDVMASSAIPEDGFITSRTPLSGWRQVLNSINGTTTPTIVLAVLDGDQRFIGPRITYRATPRNIFLTQRTILIKIDIGYLTGMHFHFNFLTAALLQANENRLRETTTKKRTCRNFNNLFNGFANNCVGVRAGTRNRLRVSVR